jgi:hypothetical protein
MSELDFHIDMNIEVPNIKADLLMESEQRLRALTENRNDFIGASISVEDIAGVEDRFLYQARIVAYLKPENIAVVEKRESAERALKDALSNIEERIRTQRDKRRKVWQQPAQRVHLSIQALTAREIYDTYIDDAISQKMLDQGRDQIAAKLMVNEKLDQESAYYAADRILEYTQQIASGK